MNSIAVLALLPLVTQGWVLLGCYQTANTSHVSTETTVQECASRCASRNSLYAALTGNYCSCATELASYVKSNDSNCSFKCSDGLSCGAFPKLFASVYKLDLSDYGTRQIPPESTVSPTPEIIFTSTTASPDSSKLILAVSLSCIGLVLLLSAGFLLYRKYKSRPSKLPIVSSAYGFLIPQVLPRTKNMIYPVHSPFTPRYYGELTLQTDDLIIVKTVYDDQWALGVNMNTAETGYFPLGALVSDTRWIEDEYIEPPQRKSSLVDMH